MQNNIKGCKTDLDFTVPSSRGDIWRLESVITENKNDTDLKLAEIKRDLELKITENKNDLELKIEKIRTEAIENKSDTDLKIEKIRTEAIENKSDVEKKIAEIKSDLERKIIESKKCFTPMVTWNDDRLYYTTDSSLKIF